MSLLTVEDKAFLRKMGISFGAMCCARIRFSRQWMRFGIILTRIAGIHRHGYMPGREARIVVLIQRFAPRFTKQICLRCAANSPAICAMMQTH